MKIDIMKFSQFIKKGKLHLEASTFVILFFLLFLSACKQDEISPPSISGISPSTGILAGGNIVSISGSGFTSGAVVSIGSKACPVASLSSSQITCIVPANSAGSYNVSVSNPNKQNDSLVSGYSYTRAAPTVTSVALNKGALAGGTTVTITGTGFYAGATVDFGGSACGSIAVVNATSITCTTIGHAPGAVAVVVTNADTQSGSAAGAYTYQAAPTVTSVAPVAGAIGGGTSVTITGTGFLTGATAKFGATACTALIVVNSTSITCTTPLQLLTGAVDVVVTNPDTQIGTLTNGYTYNLAPTVTGIAPSSGFASGATAVTITGTDFRAGATVDFAGSACGSIAVVNPTTITCTTIAHVAGLINVSVTNTDTQFGTKVNGYTYRSPPTVTSVSANIGPQAGGTAVTITGTGFYAGPTVDFGGSACGSIVVVSPTSITCTTIGHAPGAVAVAVTNADTQSVNVATAFTYLAAPTVTSVAPIAGAIGGGTSVTITGTGFVAGATVKFKTTACTALIVVNSTSITCTTPLQLLTGAVDVVVTNPDTQIGTLTNGYTYNLAPTVTGIAPSSGFASGATAVTITGTDFRAGATVDFAGSACGSIAVVNPTTITCTTIAHVAGLINVSVTNTDTQFGTKVNGYTYRSPPTVTSVSANSGALAGGTAVIITGTGFFAGPAVDFGGSGCTGITVVSDTSITCTTAAHVAGAVTVTVTNADTQSGNAATAYTYQGAPTVTVVTPSAGALAGATTVNITGTGFLTGATVKFAGNVCTIPVVVNPTTIQCSTPSSVSVGAVDVVVRNADTQTGTLTNGYIYLPAPTVTSVALNSGALGGGTSVTITGTGFIAGALADFGGSSCGTLTVVNGTTITCTTSAHVAGPVPVSVTNTDSQTGNVANAYTYRAAPTVTSVSPNGGPVGGATAVIITGTGFYAGATVDFGGSACGSIVVASTSITCTTIAHIAGAVTVTVANTDTQSGNVAGYTYRAAPTVTSVAATSGNAVGGTAVIITGTGFIAGATADFGGSACGAPFTVVNPTTITCTTAAHAGGNVTVTVTNTDTQSGNAAAAYTYIAAPTITSVANNSGALGGATAVTITGTNFVGPATVAFGGTTCTGPIVVNATTITCTTGAHAAGAVNVVVTNADSQTGTGTGAFTYRAVPTVTSVAATAGALAGGTIVTVTGTGFYTGATVDFGGSSCSTPNVTSAATITCTTTAHGVGAVTVTVTNADTQTGNAAAAYTYQAAPTVSGIVANSGFAIGGTAVTITGTGFIAGATADFGGSNCGAPYTVVNATTITCTTTAHAAGAVTVTVTNVDTQTGTKASGFTYSAAPTVTAIAPALGSIGGGTIVTITGTGFAGSGVTLGGVACTGVTVVSTTSITCTSGAHAAATINVVVTNGDTQIGSLASAFVYLSMAEISWQVGGASPIPPNPDLYGITATNVTHTYTLKNTGDVITTAITINIIGANPAAWLVGTDNCNGGTLAPGASCTVQETFLGASLAPATSFSGVLSATATSGGTFTNNISGSTP